MTLDEHRSQCIETMKLSLATKVGDLGVLGILWWEEILTAAFDSLHGIAFVCPIEATEEMILEADERAIWDGSAVRLYLAMAAAGDLTNPPEEKP